MIVVSTDLVAALYLPGGNSEIAEGVLNRDPAWASPMLWRTLFPHYLEVPLRTGAITRELADLMLEEAEKLFLSREFPAPVKDNMEILYGSRCSAFIAPFIGLANGLGVPLVTLDSEALQSFPKIAISGTEFAAGNPLSA